MVDFSPVSEKTYRPEWTPPEAGKEFASFVYSGVFNPASSNSMKRKPRRYQAEELVEGILAGKRASLSRAITLIESQSPAHRKTAGDVVSACLPYAGKSIRIGITGTPGAGKSTLIERLGLQLCQRGHRLAVLAVDPSSSLTRGSVLGDKTRMEQLACHPAAFVRPSPTGGNLGGVTRKSRESIVLCEAAGFDIIFVETVGVGQNETTVRSMVDFFLLVMIAGGGDELQGIKKGVIELADAIAVNKADGDNLTRARAARVEVNRALHYLEPATPNWKPTAVTCSALTGEGLDNLWELIEAFRSQMVESGQLQSTRNRQRLDWMLSMVEQDLIQRFHHCPKIRQLLPDIENDVLSGNCPASAGAQKLLDAYFAEIPSSSKKNDYR